jgi:hypothetical protein
MKKKKVTAESSSPCSHTYYFLLSPLPVPWSVTYSRQIFYRIIEALMRLSKTLQVTQQISSRGRITTQAIPCPTRDSVPSLQSSESAARWKMKLYIKKIEQNTGLLQE